MGDTLVNPSARKHLAAFFLKIALPITLLLVLGTVVPPSLWAQHVSSLVAVPGKTPAGFYLTNLSVGAAPGSPIDPSLPTCVITHGYNPLPGIVRLTTPDAYAMKIRQRFGNQVNVLAWHWDSRGQGSPEANNQNALQSGQHLAIALLQQGIVPEQTMLIGHSMGAVVVSTTANRLLHQTARRTDRVILIDAPMRRLGLICNELGVAECATSVTNVWAGGLSGLGAPVGDPRITNIAAPDRKRPVGCTGDLCPANNNHLDVVIWYYENYL